MFTFEKIKVKGSASKAIDRLIESQGEYEEIGSGRFGTVYGAKNSKIVYKVCEYYENGPYFAYLKELAKTKTHNPYTPKIYGVRIYTGTEGFSYERKHFIVAMERLEQPKGKFRDAWQWFERMFEYGEIKDLKGLSDGIIAGFKVVIPKEIQELHDMLESARKNSRGRYDIHGDNVMIRGKQVVVTDPLA